VKLVRNILLLCCISLLNASVVLAQGHAVVVKHELYDSWFDYGGDVTIVLHLSDPDYLCGDGSAEWIPMKLIEFIHPDGGGNWSSHGSVFTRVFYGITPADFEVDGNWDRDTYCEVIADENVMVAEGIARFNYTDKLFRQRGTEQAGYTVTGTLYDTQGGGMIGMNTVRKTWYLTGAWPESFRAMSKGPNLYCPE
jgi:hypothetical protein